MRQVLIRSLLVVVAALAVVLGVLELSEREAEGDAAASGPEPAVVEHVSGSDLSRVTLTRSAAQRLGLQTAPVRARGSQRLVPYSAVLYDERGRTWVYTNPAALTFVRAPIEIVAIRGQDAILSSGPSAGTRVASVAAAELYGTEFEVDH